MNRKQVQICEGLGRNGIYVEEDGVVIGVTVVAVDAVEALGELDVADFGADVGVHHEAHGFADGFAVVDVVVAVEVEHVGGVGEHGADAHQRVHGAGLLVVLEPRPLLPGNVHQARELVAVRVQTPAVAQKHLDHPRVVAGIVPRPRRPVLHRPSLLRHLQRLRHQRIHSHLELLILSLQGITPKVFSKFFSAMWKWECWEMSSN
jgi:hypothetical protein